MDKHLNTQPDQPTHSDAEAIEVKRIEARLEDGRMIETGLHLAEQAVMLKYIATAKFASFSPAKQARIMAQMKKLDAATLELAAAFEAMANDPDPVPATFEEALADRKQQAD